MLNIFSYFRNQKGYIRTFYLFFLMLTLQLFTKTLFKFYKLVKFIIEVK